MAQQVERIRCVLLEGIITASAWRICWKIMKILS